MRALPRRDGRSSGDSVSDDLDQPYGTGEGFAGRLFAGIPKEIEKLRPHTEALEEFNAQADQGITTDGRILAAEAAVELAKFELKVARGVAAIDLNDLRRDLDGGTP